LQANATPIKFSDERYEDLIIDVVKGEVTKEEIARFFEKGKI
jgi:hypothetical protein